MKKFLTFFLISLSLFFIQAPAHAFVCPGDPRCGDEPPSGNTNTGNIGTITPPAGAPDVAGDPSGFISGLVRNSIKILLIVAFILALIWTIIAGIKFVLAGGDPKAVSAAWSQIYWGLIGLVVVVGAFAIISMVQTFFGIHIIDNFALPTRTQ